MYVCVVCMCLCVCMSVVCPLVSTDAHRDKRVLDSLEPELRAVVRHFIWAPETSVGSSILAVCSFNHWASSPTPQCVLTVPEWDLHLVGRHLFLYLSFTVSLPLLACAELMRPLSEVLILGSIGSSSSRSWFPVSEGSSSASVSGTRLASLDVFSSTTPTKLPDTSYSGPRLCKHIRKMWWLILSTWLKLEAPWKNTARCVCETHLVG